MPKYPQSVVRKRREMVLDCLSRGLRKSAIKREVRTAFGALRHGAIEEDLRWAKDQILLAMSQPQGGKRCEALAFYRSIIADPNTEIADRIKAQERIDKLLGLELKVPNDPAIIAAILMTDLGLTDG